MGPPTPANPFQVHHPDLEIYHHSFNTAGSASWNPLMKGIVGLPHCGSARGQWLFENAAHHHLLKVQLGQAGNADTRVTFGQELNSRILVIKAAEDSAAQYMNFMNVIFAAQKQNILIDACVLDSESGLLQQASDITGGLYLKIPQMLSLSQYLLWVFLPDPEQRSQLVLPPPVHVDYRAACFCHRNLIEIGYVCSVCLSIFCNFSPICTTCETAFRIALPPVLKTKKKKPKLPTHNYLTS
ncbi:general transcription factor IIH subunit 3 isoform X4 [Hemiscyllium ocellatum]|uniref:general transcription factor IIH subunit 3 isoform X4 n=1 Tax=Hemiscyllium ocellatum TaxID=170820 RepID=UPI002966B8D2|nr:general transcription factor IIH subunit 3 isoform X4 [Hemiscyllium ocellatum]